MYGCRAAGVLCDFLDAGRCCDAKTDPVSPGSTVSSFWLLPAMMAMLFPVSRQALRLLILRRFARLGGCWQALSCDSDSPNILHRTVFMTHPVQLFEFRDFVGG